jgi:hypothetical protein
MSRRLVTILTLVVSALIALMLAFQLALGQLRGVVERALGPRASVGAVRAGWSGVELRDVRIRAERSGRNAWPADDELRATRVHVVPDIASLWSRGWRVRSVTVDDAFVSVLRTREGRLRVLPALLDTTPRPAGESLAPAPTVRIGEVRLVNAAVEFYDASVRQPPHRMRLEQLQAEVGPLWLPALDREIEIALKGVFKGPQRDGRLAIAGHLTPATRDAKIDARLSGVDLIALQPYLLRMGETGVRRGMLDLKLDAKVDQKRLNAPGTLTLTGLELAGGSFAGMPRQAVLAAMTRDGRIRVDFVLEGRLDDPKFSLNETLAMKMASALAETLGVSLSGVVQGVGGVIKGLFGK